MLLVYFLYTSRAMDCSKKLCRKKDGKKERNSLLKKKNCHVDPFFISRLTYFRFLGQTSNPSFALRIVWKRRGMNLTCVFSIFNQAFNYLFFKIHSFWCFLFVRVRVRLRSKEKYNIWESNTDRKVKKTYKMIVMLHQVLNTVRAIRDTAKN
jgi:hypothetical protein